MSSPVIDPEMLTLFETFSVARHKIFVRRQNGIPQDEWTFDEVLKRHSFCNAYRVLDYGSQYFIKNILVDHPSKPVALLRAAMYRLTNEPRFWNYMDREIGGMPELEDFTSGAIERVFHTAGKLGYPIFRPAYIIAFGIESKGMAKYEAAVPMFFDHFHPEGDKSVWPAFNKATTTTEQMQALQSVPRVGAFLAQQIVTDMGYSEHYVGTENDTVVAGPGSTKGLKYLYGAAAVSNNPNDPAHMEKMQQLQRGLHKDPALTLHLPGRAAHQLSLMDVQNLLCEFGKYMKHLSKFSAVTAQGREITKRPYTPAHKGAQDIVLPAHWAN